MHIVVCIQIKAYIVALFRCHIKKQENMLFPSPYLRRHGMPSQKASLLCWQPILCLKILLSICVIDHSTQKSGSKYGVPYLLRVVCCLGSAICSSDPLPIPVSARIFLWHFFAASYLLRWLGPFLSVVSACCCLWAVKVYLFC